MKTTITVNTAMRSAFERIKITKSAFTEKGQSLAIHINGCLEDKVGTVKVPVWNAHLSFKTAKEIGIKDGCTNPYARMRYDDMVQA